MGTPRVLIICTLLGLLCACGRTAPGNSGTLQAVSANVGSTIGGRVVDVFVVNGQRVHKSQVLVRLDDKDQRAAVAQANGALLQAESTFADLRRGPRPPDIAKAQAQASQAQHVYQQAQITAPHQIDASSQQVRQAHAAAAEASSNAKRVKQLFAKGYTSAQAVDQAVSVDRQAQAALAVAQAQLDAAQSGSVPQGVDAARQAYEAAAANAALVAAGTRPDQIAQAQAAVTTARAGVDAARARLVEMTVRAPADGTIENLDLRSGDLVAPGAAVATVNEFVDPFVRIFVAQSALGQLLVGQTVNVRSDALPSRKFTGTIESIDANAQFTPRDVQTAQDRSDLVFGVKVRVHDPDRVLRGGTTVEVGW